MRSRGRVRSRVIIVAVTLAVVAVVALLLVQEGRQDADHQQTVADWHADLAAWESAQAEALGSVPAPPGESATLADAVSGTALSPVWPDRTAAGSADALDTVNSSCTALLAYVESVEVAPEPPAPPSGLEPTDTDHARFDDGGAALADLRAALIEPVATIRALCGTYPALILAHGTEDVAAANHAVADALAVQCPVPALESACAATATAATGLADQSQTTATIRTVWAAAVVDSGAPEVGSLDPEDPEAVATGLAEALTGAAAGAEQQISDAAATFRESVQG